MFLKQICIHFVPQKVTSLINKGKQERKEGRKNWEEKIKCISFQTQLKPQFTLGNTVEITAYFGGFTHK